MPLSGGYLLDTNILVALIRDNDLGRYLDTTFGLTARAHQFSISLVTVGELLALARKFGWGPGRHAAVSTVTARFGWIDIHEAGILEAYADIDAAADAIGRNMGKNDVWIAATARAQNFTILTTDMDFDFLHGTWIDREWVDPASKLTP